MTSEEFGTEKQTLIQQVRELHDVDDKQAVEATITRLKCLNYMPIFIIETQNFFALTKADILKEIERLSNLTDAEMIEAGFSLDRDFLNLKITQMRLLVYHFRLLLRLRNDEADAWDEIDELYTDD